MSLDKDNPIPVPPSLVEKANRGEHAYEERQARKRLSKFKVPAFLILLGSDTTDEAAEQLWRALDEAIETWADATGYGALTWGTPEEVEAELSKFPSLRANVVK